MAVLSRVNITSQQRFDLAHFLALESYNAFDFRALISAFAGSNALVVRGFEVVGKTGLAISVSVKDCFVFNPLDQASSFYFGMPDDPDVQLDLEPSQSNIFIEASFVLVSQAPTTNGFWNPLASTTDSPAGSQFAATQNSQVIAQIVISANTVSFSPGAIPILQASTSASSVTGMIDSRPLFFRLGTGGANPDPFHSFPFSPDRSEPVYEGTGVGDSADSPFRSSDVNGIRNDKGIRTLKEAFDALTTRISEISGSPLWYTNSIAQQYVSGLNTNILFFDSQSGHYIQPSKSTSFKLATGSTGSLAITQSQWQSGNTVRLYMPSTANVYVGNPITVSGFQNSVNNGTFIVTAVTPTYTEITNTGVGSSSANEIYAANLIGQYYLFSQEGTTPASWQSNYQSLNWSLGGSYVSSTSRTYASSTFFVNVPEGSNVYLLLEREMAKGSGNPVSWQDNTNFALYPVNRAISGLAGDFTGIAIGDYIRKQSEGMSRYYRVAAFSNGTIDTTTPNEIADNTIVCVKVETDIIGNVSTESLRYYRSHYSVDDVVVDPYQLHPYLDVNYYWLGRKRGDLFVLRDYGILQAGEEVNTLDDSSTGWNSSGVADIILEHGFGSSAVAGVYKKDSTDTQPLLTIRRRKSDDTVPYAGPVSNSGAMLTYTIPYATQAAMNVGDSLWVRLSDSISGALTNAAVVSPSDDLNNTDINTNRFQFLSDTNAPVRTFDNRNIFQIAKYVTLTDGALGLAFIDGTVLSYGGTHINNNVVVRGTSIVEAGQNVFVKFYNNTGSSIPQYSAVKVTGIVDYIELASAAAQSNTEGTVGFASIDIPDSTWGLVQTSGKTRVLTAGGDLLIGKQTFLSVASGAVSKAPPANSGESYCLMGTALDVDLIQIGIDFEYVLENIYEEKLIVGDLFPLGVVAGSQLILPQDSRANGSDQSYVVGAGHLIVHLNGQRWLLESDYQEVGNPAEISSQVKTLIDLIPEDVLTFRIELDQKEILSLSGGGGGGGGSQNLQQTYANGRTITVTTGNPVEISGPSGTSLFKVNGNALFGGILTNSKGNAFAKQSSLPFAPTEYGLWVDSSGNLNYYGSSTGVVQNITQLLSGGLAVSGIGAPLPNVSGGSIPAFCPISIDTNGGIKVTDVSVETDAFACSGITQAIVNNGFSGDIVYTGILSNIGPGYALGTPLFVAKSGGLTSIKPSIGVGGFLAGDFVISVGIVMKNQVNPALLDLLVRIQVVGQL